MIMRFFVKILSVLVGLMVLFLIVFMLVFYMAGRSALKSVGNFVPDESELADGKYEGEFSCLGGYLNAEVNFEIRNHKLWLIQFEKLYGTSFTGSAQKVYFAIDDNKKLNFDAVTGATVTSNLAKAAIKDAIRKGPH
jgi:uncharacterized protein with FMN-binding domain